MRLGLALASAPRDAALAVELERRSPDARRAARRARSAAGAARPSTQRRARARRRPRAGRRGAAPGRRSAARRCGSPSGRRSAPRRRELDGHAQPVDVRPQGAERRRRARAEASARRGRARTSRTPARRRRGRAASPAGTKCETSAMCTQARMPSSSRTTEIASSKSFAVSGSIVKVVRSRRSARPSGVRRRRLERLERLPRAALDEQPLEHGLDPVGRPEHALDLRAPAAARDDGELAPLGARAATCGRGRSASPGAKYGSPTTSFPRLAISTTVRPAPRPTYAVSRHPSHHPLRAKRGSRVPDDVERAEWPRPGGTPSSQCRRQRADQDQRVQLERPSRARPSSARCRSRAATIALPSDQQDHGGERRRRGRRAAPRP